MNTLLEALCSPRSRRKVEVELQVTCLIHVISYFDPRINLESSKKENGILKLKEQYHGFSVI